MADWKDITSVRQLVALKRAAYAGLIGASIPAFATTIGLIKKLSAAKVRHPFKMAVASSSEFTAEILQRLKLTEYFDVIVFGHRAGVPVKPSKEFYRLVSRRVGVPLSASALIEDGPVSVDQAKSTGLGLAIGIDRGGDKDRLAEAGADLVVQDAAQIKPSWIFKRLPGLQAVIFDSDGVIVDTEPLHFQTAKRVLDGYFRYRQKAYGEPFSGLTVAEYEKYIKSKNTETAFPLLLSSRGIHLSGTP